MPFALCTASHRQILDATTQVVEIVDLRDQLHVADRLTDREVELVYAHASNPRSRSSAGPAILPGLRRA